MGPSRGHPLVSIPQSCLPLAGPGRVSSLGTGGCGSGSGFRRSRARDLEQHSGATTGGNLAALFSALTRFERRTGKDHHTRTGQGVVRIDGRGNACSRRGSLRRRRSLRLSGQTFPSERPGFTCYTVLQPVGIVVAISPWNFPVVSSVRKIAPALACGNTVILKPASLTPRSAKYITSLFENPGLHPGFSIS